MKRQATNNSAKLVSVERLHECFSYEPDTGLLRYRIVRGVGRNLDRIVVGAVAGYIKDGSYPRIVVDGCYLRLHRVAWAMHYGQWPEGEIDHVNGVQTDNRIANLRASSRAENQHNMGLRATNTSGYRGVVWHPQTEKWRTRITVHGIVRHIGLFYSAEEASAAYEAAAKRLHGEFYRAPDHPAPWTNMRHSTAGADAVDAVAGKSKDGLPVYKLR